MLYYNYRPTSSTSGNAHVQKRIKKLPIVLDSSDDDSEVMEVVEDSTLTPEVTTQSTATSQQLPISCDGEEDSNIMEVENSSDRESSFSFLTQPNIQYLGKKIRMRFKLAGKGRSEFKWYQGQILNFDPLTGKYGVFFPSDQETVYIDLVKEAEDIVFIP